MWAFFPSHSLKNILNFLYTVFIVFFVSRRPLTANHYFKYFLKWRFLCFEQLSYTLDSTLLYSNIILSLLLGFRPKLLDLFSYVCTITYTVMYFSPLEKNYVRHNLLIVDTVGSVGSYLWRRNKLRFYWICYTVHLNGKVLIIQIRSIVDNFFQPCFTTVHTCICTMYILT